MTSGRPRPRMAQTWPHSLALASQLNHQPCPGFSPFFKPTLFPQHLENPSGLFMALTLALALGHTYSPAHMNPAQPAIAWAPAHTPP